MSCNTLRPIHDDSADSIESAESITYWRKLLVER
jgi:hypothetical protein